MKQLNTYISEKLRISNDTKVSKHDLPTDWRYFCKVVNDFTIAIGKHKYDTIDLERDLDLGYKQYRIWPDSEDEKLKDYMILSFYLENNEAYFNIIAQGKSAKGQDGRHTFSASIKLEWVENYFGTELFSIIWNKMLDTIE